MKSALVVDDSDATRAFIKSLIEDIGDVRVSEASTGFEALKFLPLQSFDVITVDINMPDINGLELISFVKGNDQYKKIPVIIISTEGSEEDKKKGLSLGAVAYLTKPFKSEDLQRTVKKALNL
ncbi:MAG: response regulator [Nitrospirae bacterium]|nr:response regulator [Nitrospirota bacterium]